MCLVAFVLAGVVLAGVAVVAGAAAVVGLLTATLAVGVVATEHRAGASRGATEDPSGTTAPVVVPRPTQLPKIEADTSGLSDEELCWLWRWSYRELLLAVDDDALDRMAEGRRLLLDEMERRHRQGFLTWMSSGASAGGDPSRYLARRRPR